MTTFTTQDRIDAERTPLTDEEITNLFRAASDHIEFARAIERAHGITE